MSALEKVEPKQAVKLEKNNETIDLPEMGSKNESPKKLKVKKKIKYSVSEVSSEVNSNADFKQKKRNMKKKVLLSGDFTDSSKQNVKQIEKENLHIKEEVIHDGAHPDETIDWPEKDLSKLIGNIEAALPEKDNLAFNTRVEKLNWDDIAFNEYSGEVCKKTWQLIQKRVRRFRLLIEVLQDAKEWISKPWTNFYGSKKTKRHPNMPRRPLSAYLLFYIKTKAKIVSKNPGLERTEVSKEVSQLYKNISAAKRAKYIQMAAEERKNYEEKLAEFYRIHPEFQRYVEESNFSKPVENGPKKPLTPFGLFFEEQLKTKPTDSEVDHNALKQECKEHWVLDKEAKYQNELKHDISQNPNFELVQLKPILTNEEKLLREKLVRKPKKPPTSAYGLFLRMMLPSKEIKKVQNKDRMKVIADQWRNCTDKEKKQYRKRINHLKEQYKLDFASYLESLPEERRQEELKTNLPKRKIKTSKSEETPQKKKKSNNTSNTENPNPAVNEAASNDNRNEEDPIPIICETEPSPPPVSGFVLFSKMHHGKVPVETAWENLSNLEKREYEAEVQKLKQKYIKEYKKFLESLSKEQLIAFSQLKRKREGLSKNKKEGKFEDSSSSCSSENENESSDANSN